MRGLVWPAPRGAKEASRAEAPPTKRGRGKRILLAAIVASLSVTAALAIGILLFGDFGEREGRILTTTAMLAGYGLLALPAGFLFDLRRLQGLAAALLGLVVVGFGLGVTSVWTEDPPDALPKTLATITAFAVASTQIAALAARRDERDPRAVRVLFATSTAVAPLLAAMVTVASWAEVDSSAYYRILAALAVLDVLIVALQPILALTRRTTRPYRLRILVEPDEMIETTVDAEDLGSAAKRAILTIEHGGRDVIGLQLCKPNGPPGPVKKKSIVPAQKD